MGGGWEEDRPSEKSTLSQEAGRGRGNSLKTARFEEIIYCSFTQFKMVDWVLSPVFGGQAYAAATGVLEVMRKVPG